ncbi:MAG: UDP-N-acetylmuramate--L-alanine ligase [Planctomycetaceae bacterium]|nr:UDP-N-acetylmuramate--L-alanine ligase [Planctomycetaceae bacterium]
MSRLDLKHVHIVGIGGAGTSALANILLQQDIGVSGSDKTPSAVTERLIDRGVSISYTESYDNVPDHASMVVYSAAVREEHLERKRAREMGIPERKYSEVLGMLTGLRQTIAICGTHGKTTTTSMIAGLLHRARKRPSWLVGGVPTCLPASSNWDNGTNFVVEACEYDRSFLNLEPSAIVLHNIEPDHMEYFGTFENLVQAFADFTALLAPRSVLFANWDNEAVRDVARSCKRRVIRYGIEHEEATYRARDIEIVDGYPVFSLMKGKRELTRVRLAVPGKVNVINGLASATVGHWAGLEPEFIASALAETTGVKRRFEVIGDYNTAPVVDDYAHHPTAVRELVQTARAAYPERWITFVFQAHQYARLLRFFGEFTDALSGVDEVLVCRTYAAREAGVMPGEPEERLAKELRRRGVVSLALSTFDGVLNHLRAGWRPDKAFITVGAGDVTEIGHRLVEEGYIRSGRYDKSGIPRS